MRDMKQAELRGKSIAWDMINYTVIAIVVSNTLLNFYHIYSIIFIHVFRSSFSQYPVLQTSLKPAV